MVDYCLICAPPGTGLGHAVARIKQELGDAVQHADVEAIWKEPDFRAAHSLPNPETGDVRDVTWTTPRARVIQLWREAFNVAVQRFAPGEHTRLLSCHITLYSGRRNDFYSPLDIPTMLSSEAKAAGVLLLIDDIFDMYQRLTGENSLFETNLRERKYFDEVAGEVSRPRRGSDGTPEFAPTVAAELRAESAIEVLSNVLAWRRSDMILGESLASQLGAQFLAFGVKQSAAVAAHWLETQLGDAASPAATVYLSHPISRPRRDWRRSGRWDATDTVVQDFNELQARLAAKRVLCVMPTAIDEFRLARTPVPGQAIPRRLAKLEERWPLPVAKEEIDQTLYAPPDPSLPWPDYPQFLPAPPESSPRVDVLVRVLENRIKAEVPFRDHLLVARIPHLLVFRPLYEEGRFSDGVAAEILHWDLPGGFAEDRRAVFVHYKKDLVAWRDFAARADAKRRRIYQLTYEDQLKQELAEAFGPDQVRALVTGQATRSSLLDTGIFPKVDEALSGLASARRRAQSSWFRYELTSGTTATDRVGLWVVTDTRELRNSMSGIAAFIRGEEDPPPEPEWTEPLDECLGQPRHLWLSQLLESS